MSNELTHDLRALVRSTEQVPSLVATRSALETAFQSRKESFMSKINRRPLVAIAVAAIILIGAPVAYALVTDRFHLFVDADQPVEQIQSSLDKQREELGANAAMSAEKTEAGVKVKLTWGSLKEMFADCLDDTGTPRPFEATVVENGKTVKHAIDRDRDRLVMEVLVAADALHDELEEANTPEDEALAQTIAFLNTRLAGLGIVIPPAASDSPIDQIKAIERAVTAWLAGATPYEFHVEP